MPQNASGRLKTCLLSEPMLSDGLQTALNDNSCEMGGIFCYTQRQVYLLMAILGVFLGAVLDNQEYSKVIKIFL